MGFNFHWLVRFLRMFLHIHLVASCVFIFFNREQKFNYYYETLSTMNIQTPAAFGQDGPAREVLLQKESLEESNLKIMALDSNGYRPTKFDVIFGRGRPFQDHDGNIRLHKLVEFYKPRYLHARRLQKTKIASEIVQLVKETGHFMKRSKGEDWTEVCDLVARDKVSHALRGKPRHTHADTASDSEDLSTLPKSLKVAKALSMKRASETGNPKAKKRKLDSAIPQPKQVLPAIAPTSLPGASVNSLFPARSLASIDALTTLNALFQAQRSLPALLGLAPNALPLTLAGNAVLLTQFGNLPTGLLHTQPLLNHDPQHLNASLIQALLGTPKVNSALLFR